MSNANRDYAIVYDIKNSSLVLSRPLVFYITDKNTSNIIVRLVTRVSVGNGIDQYTNIEEASNYVLTMRVIKPNNEVKSIEATQHETESIFQFDLTEDFKDIAGKYICELTISTIVNGRQELITSDPFNYEVKRSILSNVGEIIETEDTTVEKLLNDLDATKAEFGSQIKKNVKDIHSRIDNIVASAGDGTKDTEIIDARGGDVCLNNRFVGIESGEYIHEISFEKIKKAKPQGEVYSIDDFNTWSKWSATTGDTDKVTSLDNGGINISIPDDLTGNLVVSKNNINLQGKKLTLKFDITVTSEPTSDARFSLALNDSLTLATIYLNKYKTNKKTTISIDFNDDKLLSGKLAFVFRLACNFKLENIQLEECTKVEGYQSLEEVINDVTLLKNNSEDIRDFVLPSTIPTVLELETNIFWDNILLNTNIKNVSRIDVANSIGGRKNVMEDRWRILLPKGTTDITQTFNVYFDNTSKINKSVKANIKVLNKSIGSGLTKKIIFIGDSLTDNNKYEPELINMFADDVMDIELLGSRGSSPALHEGRSGWTTKHYCTEESYNNRTNAFFNTATSKFDFSYYMNNQGYTDVDYVFINMGTNDLANSNSETLGYFKEMVQSIKNYNNNISVFIGLCPPLSSQHDNVGFKNKRIQLMQLLLAEFDNRESEKIFINPLVLNFDAKNGFPTQNITGTRHNEELKVVTDNTHPLNSEYFKMADTIYCVLKYAVSLE